MFYHLVCMLQLSNFPTLKGSFLIFGKEVFFLNFVGCLCGS